MKTIILNYNLGPYADEIYEKLISDGFHRDDIILVDNGSDKNPLAKNTNFQLPYNIRLQGQLNIALSYLLNYFAQDFIFTITTSAKLKNEINYFKVLNECINDLKIKKLGFIACCFSGEEAKHFPQVDIENLTQKYSIINQYQPIACIYSHEILRECLDRKAGPFNIDLKRGWGMALELKYVAEKLKMKNYVAKDFEIIWRKNYLHNIGLADESVSQYHKLAREEMFASFNKKYGKNWEFLFHIKEKKSLVSAIYSFLLRCLNKIIKIIKKKLN